MGIEKAPARKENQPAGETLIGVYDFGLDVEIIHNIQINFIMCKSLLQIV